VRLALRPAPESYDAAFMRTMASAYLDQTAWTRLRLATVRALVEPAPGDRVLDLGCAAGAVTHYLSTFGCDAVGVDAEALAVEVAGSTFPGLRFELADVTALPFAAATFEKAVAADLVEHLDDAAFAAMLAEVHRVLVPGGTLSVYTPNPRHPIERLKARNLLLAENPTHVGLRTEGALAAGLGAAGLAVDRREWRPGFVPGLRLVERLGGGRFETLRYRLALRGRKAA
jgi:SAM-dependent methyltransferase